MLDHHDTRFLSLIFVTIVITRGLLVSTKYGIFQGKNFTDYLTKFRLRWEVMQYMEDCNLKRFT